MSNNLRLDFELGMNAKDLKKGFTEAKGDLNKLKEAFTKALGSLPTGSASKGLGAVSKELKSLISQVEKLQAAGKKSLFEATPRRQNIISGGTTMAATGMVSAAPTKAAATAAKELAAAEREVAKAAKAAREEQKAEAAVIRNLTNEVTRLEHATQASVFGNDELAKHAITLRYALYDVSSVARSAGQAFIGFSADVMKASIAQEKSFSQVEKALVGTDTGQLEKLQQELVALSRQVPVTFDELAKIGMLGAQLGVASSNIAAFTDTVAKFSAITGMTVDATAMGFGKIANLLGLQADQYQALGSAIAYVGNKSAATEEQIINTAGQIAAVGKNAGLSASQVIGLASTMASLKIAPEEARSVLVQLFNTINDSTLSYVEQLGKGGDKLKLFAEIAGVSQKEFVDKWGDKAGGASEVWGKFVENLGAETKIKDAMGNVTKESYNVGEVLKKLGLDGVRTSKGITALAKNFTMLSAQMKFAKDMGKTGDFLDLSFATIAEDMASKLKTLENSVQALYATMGNNTVVKATFGFIVDGLKNLTIAISALNSNPVGQFISGLVLAMTALIGVIMTAVAVFAISAGSLLAFRTAIANAATMGVGFSSSMVKVLVALRLLPPAVAQNVAALEAQRAATAAATAAQNGLTVATIEGAAGMKIFGLSVKSMLVTSGIGIALLIIGAIAGAMMEAADAGDEGGRGIDEMGKAAIENAKNISMLKSEIIELFDAIAAGPDAARKLDNSLYNLGKAAAESGKGFVDGTQGARDFLDNINTVVNSAVMLYGESNQDLGNYLTQFLDYLISTGNATSGTIDYIKSKIASLGDFTIDGIVRFNPAAFTEGMDSFKKSAAGATKQVETLLEKVQQALKLLNNNFSMSASLRDLGSSLQEVGNSFSYMTDAGNSNFDALNSAIESIVTNASENAKMAADDLAALRMAMWRVGITSTVAFNAVDRAIAATGKKGKATSADIAKFMKLITTGMAADLQKNVRSVRDWANDVNTIMSTAFDIRYGAGTALNEITTGWDNMRKAAADAAEAIDEANQSIKGLTANKAVLEYQLKIAVKYGDNLRANQIRAEIDKVSKDLSAQNKAKAEAESAANKSLTDGSSASIANRASILDMVKTYQSYLVALTATTTDSKKLEEAATSLTSDFVKQATQLGFSKTEVEKFATAINTDYVTAIRNAPKEITLDVVGVDPAIAAVADFVSRANAELAKINVIDVSGNVVSVNANANAPVPAAPKPGAAPQTKVTGVSAYTGTSGGNGGLSASQIAAQNKANAVAAKALADAKAAQAAQAKAKAAIKTPSEALVIATQKKASLLEDLVKEDNGWTAFFNPRRYNYVHQEVQTLRTDIAKFNSTYGAHWLDSAHYGQTYLGPGKAAGGLITGPGSSTSDSILTPLSNGEFVVKASAVQNYGLGFMNALNSQQVSRPGMGASAAGSASGGGNMVYLSPEDRQLLRAAADRPIALYTENTKIAQSANAGNVILAQRGSN